MTKAHGYAALNAKAELTPFDFDRREMRERDVRIEILHCGICHSDLFFVDNDWGMSLYPMVPGHEIVGRVTDVGRAVTKFAVGDMAAIGCIVDSCRHCEPCGAGNEHMCVEHPTPTYSGHEREGGLMTFGGYSDCYVADEAYMLRVPDGLDPAGAAPLLCAGITTYSPLRHWHVGPGKKVGIIGIGGLGHVAIKLAAAMGAEVVALTTSAGKVDEVKRLGAQSAIISSDPDQMAAATGSLDFLLDTVSVAHALDPYLALLKQDATLCLVGAPADAMTFNAFSLIAGRKSVAGSPIGGIHETQEMLDFCGQHNVTADIERIAIQDINTAYERLRRGDVKYRFVIDMATLSPQS